MDSPTHPDDHDSSDSSTAETYLSIVEAAKELQVDRRTVLRYILDGIAGPSGTRIRLEAQLLTTQYGQEYQIGRSKLDDFKQLRQMPTRERHSRSNVSGAQLVAEELELERLHQDLRLAYELVRDQSAEIERLATRTGEFEGENRALREQLARSQRGLLSRVLAFLLS